MSRLIDTIPVMSSARIRDASKPVGRREFIKRTTSGALGLGIAYLGLFKHAPGWAAADGNYFKEWTGTSAGPCDATSGYARNHTEDGVKCGPSTPCNNQACCSFTTTGTGERPANIGNTYGWHKYDINYTGTSYWQRPDECYSGSPSNYDSWRWTYSDGKTYGCSDGHTCTTTCFKSICPFQR